MEDEVIEQQEPAEVESEIAEEAQEPVSEAPAAEEEGETETVEPQARQQEQQERQWVKDLRKQHRELVKQNRELAAQLQAVQAPKAQALGDKPKLADFEYDPDEFEAALDNWHTKKRAHDDQEAQRRAAIEAQEREWSNRLAHYAKEKAEIDDPDFEEAEFNVQQLFNETQQGILLHGLETPARVISQLGRDQQAAERLSAIKDPVKFAIALADYRRDKTMTPTKKAPPPERVVSTAPVKNNSARLEQLRTEAEKTGDYSKVLAYKKQLRGNK